MIDPVAKLIELAGPKPRVAVAFSGGIDSTVLAHLLVKARRKLGGLRIVHVDHGLQAASGEWSRHCARMARSWRIPFVSLRAKIERKRGESPEAAARAARYTLLAQAMEADEVLVTAQHLDDQVETLLLQLFRGAGVAGLAAMPELAAFGPGRIARPLLRESREELEDYAKAHRLRWVEDPTNMETHFARNYLRHRVMPAIRERWPGVDACIARSASHMSEAEELLAAIARADLLKVADGDGLNVVALRALPKSRRRNALRAFIARLGIEAPSTAQMMVMTGSLLIARPDALPEIRWNGAVIRRRAGRIELEVRSADRIEAAVEMGSKSWHWESDRKCALNRAGDFIELFDDDEGPIDLDRLPRLLELRARRGGEQLRPSQLSRTKSLKKLMQSARMSVEDRARMPLLFAGGGPTDRLIAAGDRWIDASIAATVKSRRRARLKWSPANSDNLPARRDPSSLTRRDPS